MRSNSHSGQALLVAVLILTLLVLSIPVIISTTGTGFRHGVRSESRQKARAIAEYALEQGMNAVADPSIWPLPEIPVFPKFVLGESYETMGGTFSVKMNPYADSKGQMFVEAYYPDATRFSGIHASITAIIKPVTVGIRSPSGVKASAALQIGSSEPTVPMPPVVKSGGVLQVHWGPIVVNSTTTWTVTGDMETNRYPRKFTLGAVTGGTYPRAATSNPPNTDNKEYWAYIDPGNVPAIDVPTYMKLASDARIASPMIWTGGGTWSTYPSCSGGMICPAAEARVAAKITVPGGITGTNIAVFGTPSTSFIPYVIQESTVPIVIDGNAEWRDVSIDLNTLGLAFIVTGNLNIGARTNASTPGIAGMTMVKIPPDARKEYPYYASGWTCSNETDGICDLSGKKPRFRGFLYVKGNLIVNSPSDPVVLIGSVRVDGKITVESNTVLEIYYDVNTNHRIRVAPVELQVESRHEEIR